MSADLYWMISRNNNAYLMKKRDIKKPFSTVSTFHSNVFICVMLDCKYSSLFQEPGNLKNVASFRYSGLVQPKTVDIQAAKDGKGFVVTTKRSKKQVL